MIYSVMCDAVPLERERTHEMCSEVVMLVRDVHFQDM